VRLLNPGSPYSDTQIVLLISNRYSNTVDFDIAASAHDHG